MGGKSLKHMLLGIGLILVAIFLWIVIIDLDLALLVYVTPVFVIAGFVFLIKGYKE